MTSEAIWLHWILFRSIKVNRIKIKQKKCKSFLPLPIYALLCLHLLHKLPIRLTELCGWNVTECEKAPLKCAACAFYYDETVKICKLQPLPF